MVIGNMDGLLRFFETTNRIRDIALDMKNADI